MENSFKYVFVQTKPSWFIGSYRSSLSFSSDGTTIAGSLAAMNNPNYSNDQVKFWETATGATTSTFDNWSFVVFSPTDPDMGIIATSTCFRTMKRDSPGGNRWSLQGPGRFAKLFNAGLMPTFRSDGKTFVIRGRDGRFHEYDSTNTTSVLRDIQPSHFMATVVADCPLEPELFILGRENGWLEILSYYTDISKSTLNLHCELTPVGSVRISACAWSQDGKWIATGDDVGDIRLWNAGVTTSISLARLLPRDRSSPITSLIFVPDSTAFIILCGGYLTVWDIARGVYVANSGLPATAMSIALDGPRNRVAVAVDDMIFLYQLKLPQQRLPVHSKLPQQRLPVQKKLPQQTLLAQEKLRQQMLPGQQKLPHHNRQRKEKSSIPSELAELDITNQVVISKLDPFVSFYFDIYRGVWNLDTPRIFQPIVTIKALRAGFSPRSKTQERQDFGDLLTEYLAMWSNLSHDNLVPLLGISMDFGVFPAIVTLWMSNGLLSEYIKSDEEYDKMELVTGVARGVAYLHSEGIVHSDIRASSFLVDELGTARLADPGLLSVLANSPLIASGTMNVSYRWMAPELLKISSAKATFATNVYSVTMTFLEIFTASDPFKGDSDALVLSQVVQNQRPDKPDDIEDGLWSLWGEGWNQDAAKRPDMESYVKRLAQLV